MEILVSQEQAEHKPAGCPYSKEGCLLAELYEYKHSQQVKEIGYSSLFSIWETRARVQEILAVRKEKNLYTLRVIKSREQIGCEIFVPEDTEKWTRP